jgi:hypothetical protein
MFLRLLIWMVIFYLVLNFSNIRKGKLGEWKSSLLLPFSLALAMTVVDAGLRLAFYSSAIIFLLLAVASYLVLRKLTRH